MSRPARHSCTVSTVALLTLLWILPRAQAGPVEDSLFFNWLTNQEMVQFLTLDQMYQVEFQILDRYHNGWISRDYAMELLERSKKEIEAWEAPMIAAHWKTVGPLWKRAAGKRERLIKSRRRGDIGKAVRGMAWWHGPVVEKYVQVLQAEMTYYSRDDHWLPIAAIITPERVILSGYERRLCAPYTPDIEGRVTCLGETLAGTTLEKLRYLDITLSRSNKVYLRAVVLEERKDDPITKRFLERLNHELSSAGPRRPGGIDAS